MPPAQSLADLETLQELHPNKAHSLEAIIASMEYAKPYRYFENYPDWDNIFWTQSWIRSSTQVQIRTI